MKFKSIIILLFILGLGACKKSDQSTQPEEDPIIPLDLAILGKWKYFSGSFKSYNSADIVENEFPFKNNYANFDMEFLSRNMLVLNTEWGNSDSLEYKLTDDILEYGIMEEQYKITVRNDTLFLEQLDKYEMSADHILGGHSHHTHSDGSIHHTDEVLNVRACHKLVKIKK